VNTEQPLIHEKAIVEAGARIGAGTKVWALAHILGEAVIGCQCNICDHTFIEGNVTLGDRVTVKCGVYLWDGITVEDDVFIGPAAVFTNDLRPRSRRYPPEFLKTLLKANCSIGANATILPGLTVGRYAMVGAGSVVTKSVPDYALVLGNPARFHSWICTCSAKLDFAGGPRADCNCGLSFRLPEIPGKPPFLDSSLDLPFNGMSYGRKDSTFR
jgi:acetyltransferase-like isoleucine patch superfamily enzyme